MLDPRASAATGSAALAMMRAVLAEGLQSVFFICLLGGIAAVIIAVMFPRGAAAQHAHQEPVPAAHR